MNSPGNSPKGDISGGQTSAMNNSFAARQIDFKCPQCSHRFNLADSQVCSAQASPGSAVAPSESVSVSPEQQGGNSGHSMRKSKEATAAKQDSIQGMQIFLKPTVTSSPPSESPTARDQPTFDVVRNYQITNTTIEQLERVITDKTDRRIRKIASLCGCSIDLRSELPACRFGVAKNFCVLRSRCQANIDSCKCMLTKQLCWNLSARPT